MSDGQPKKGSASMTWFNRISQAFFGEPQGREELVDLLRDAKEREVLDQNALSMLEGALQISELQARDIMIPKAQMVCVKSDMSFTDLLPQVVQSAHSRFPVIEGEHEDVIGILLAKDLLSYILYNNAQNFHIRDVLREANVIPESKRLNTLLKEFRETHSHMAIVVDEHASVAGLVTIEDVLEQIVGEIEDEHDLQDISHITKLAPGEYRLQALTPIDEFNQTCGSNFSDEEQDTIGGLVINALGHVPERQEQVVIDNILFEVIKADQRRIHLLKATTKTNNKKDTDSSEPPL